MLLLLLAQVQLILPEALKLLPLYSLALHKSNMLRPDVKADDRSAWLAGIVGASPPRMMGLLHPRLYAVHNLLVSVVAGCVCGGAVQIISDFAVVVGMHCFDWLSRLGWLEENMCSLAVAGFANYLCPPAPRTQHQPANRSVLGACPPTASCPSPWC